MKDILIVAHYSGEFDMQDVNRFQHLARLLTEKEYNVELVTSSFSHRSKTKREPILDSQVSFQATALYEPSYQKNVSLKRLVSHYVLGKNLNSYLEKRKKPDLIYIAVPSLDVAKTAIRYAKANNIKTVIDIQDIWPEAFQMIIKNKYLGQLLFNPIFKQANYIYKNADGIVAVSDTYKDMALAIQEKKAPGLTVFLGSDLKRFDRVSNHPPIIEIPKDTINLAYVGTLGHSYDLTTVFEAMTLLKSRSPIEINFIVMGDGPLKQKFETYAKENNLSVTFTGRLPFDQMVATLTKCDIAINSISQGAAQSIINKHSDYASAGLPVLNTQENQEYRSLVEDYQVGFNCINNDSQDFSEKLLLLIEDQSLREKFGRNHRLLAEQFFDREQTYGKIVQYMNEVYLA